MKKLIIPDTQVKPGVPMDHMTWVGKYMLDIEPDCVVHLGDHFDMPAAGYYNRNKLKGEGERISADIAAGNEAMHMLMAPLIQYNQRQARFKKKQFNPRKVALLGNHEYRLMRYVDDHPEMAGTLGYHLFDWDKCGWEVVDFLSVIDIAGVKYSHYFANPKTGRPYGGMMETRLKNIGFSFTQGHVQGLQHGQRELADGQLQRGLVAGSCYLHEEDYRGPQGNHEWRGVIVKHECANGQYDLMEVSLNYLCRKYEQIPLDKFMKDKYSINWPRRG